MITIERVVYCLLGRSDTALVCWATTFGYGQLDTRAYSTTDRR